MKRKLYDCAVASGLQAQDIILSQNDSAFWDMDDSAVPWVALAECNHLRLTGVASGRSDPLKLTSPSAFRLLGAGVAFSGIGKPWGFALIAGIETVQLALLR